MRKFLTHKVLVPLAAVLGALIALSAPAFAHQDINYWHVPGHKAVSKSADGRDKHALDCAATLHAPPDVIRKFLERAQRPGKRLVLTKGMRFSQMTYGDSDCHIEYNVEVHFLASVPLADWQAEEIDITGDDGKTYVFVRPYACNNWSLLTLVIPSRPHCFVMNFDYRSNTHVMQEGNLKTADALVASGDWKGSDDQSYLNGDTLFAFVVMHLDFTDAAEQQRFQDDECTGVGDDATGFHHIVEFNCEICVRGKWPLPQMIEELFEARGIRLPAQKPQGAFRFPCAEGKCYFSMPLWAARAFLACVEVPRYHTTLPGFYRDRDVDNFDVVTAEEVQYSLARGKRAKGNVVLVNRDRSTRSLTGIGSYTVPGSY